MTKYACGHETPNSCIIMDCNPLSMSAYLEWVEGEKHLEKQDLCFDCWSKDEREEERKFKERMEGKTCCYCGEHPATMQIIDPNTSMDEGLDAELRWWDVCETCDKVISAQQLLSLGMVLQEKGSDVLKQLGEKMVQKEQEKLDALAEESGIPILMVKIEKKEDGFDVSETLHLGVPKKGGDD